MAVTFVAIIGAAGFRATPGVLIVPVSTAATESILQVLPPSRAGVGSAVNDATRELGGTLASPYADKLLALLAGVLDGPTLERARQSVGFADAVAAKVPGLNDAVDSAFLSGLEVSCIRVGILCLVGAAVSFFSLPGETYDPLAESNLHTEPLAAEVGP
jgi:hypothetical protein